MRDMIKYRENQKLSNVNNSSIVETKSNFTRKSRSKNKAVVNLQNYIDSQKKESIDLNDGKDHL